MAISKLWIVLTLPIALLMALASAAGIFVESVYAREAVSWAAQGVGQDIVNLCVTFPALLVSSYFLCKGSRRALLVWMGLLLYVIYSYVLYAFFVHFNAWFLVYVAILGLSFYTLLGGVMNLRQDALTQRFATNTQAGVVSMFLMVVGVLFGILWLTDILSALLTEKAPQSVTEIGLPVNPVHVLDLSLLLPAMIITSVLLKKRKILGYLWAVPLMVFAAVMGMAIVSMTYVMNARGVPAPIGVTMIIGAIVLISLYLSYRFLMETHS